VVRDLGDVAANLHEVMASLRRWSKTKFSAVMHELENLRKKLEALAGQNNTQANVEAKNL
jgi:hypothetical protein